MAPLRRSRVLLITFISSVALLFYAFRQGFFLASPPKMEARRPNIQEIHGLLHLVVQSNGTLPIDGSVNPAQQVSFETYAAASGKDDFVGHAMRLMQETPVVVFSKSYCPYSQKAKRLISQYDLSPKPVIIELDHRQDGAVIQQILGRLTGRRTVPNILIQGNSIGGSDDVHALHASDKLVALFTENGVRVQGV